MSRKKIKKNSGSKVKLIKIEGKPGVYTSTGSYHSTGTIDFSELSNRITNPLLKTLKARNHINGWPVVDKD